VRHLLGWFSLAVFAAGCSTGELLPTTPSQTGSPLATAVQFNATRLQSNGNWLPWFFPVWQPGVGERLVLGTNINSVVAADDLCVPNLRSVWDAGSSCKRFVVSVTSDGWLNASLKWDTSAPGFDPARSGEVVFVAADGRFAASDWLHAEEHLAALVEPGDYGVLVMSYAPASLPFQINLELNPK
jgi:hypothetical protein